MKDGKKNGFFSWLKTAVMINKTSDMSKDDILKEKNKNKILLKNQSKKFINVQENLSDLNSSLILKKDLKKNSKKILNKNDDSILKTDRVQKSFFLQLKQSLVKTKKFLGDGISRLFISKKIDQMLFEELEEKMLLADIGIDTTDRIINNLMNDIQHNELQNSEKIYYLLKKNMYNILKAVEIPLKISKNMPFIILVVGVNGVGKTTTTVKLAKKYKSEGKSVILAAADTFRAAGIEQLKVLGKANNISVIAQSSGSDPASVVFDAVKSAISKKVDVLIIDTAGRLHNKLHLMEELKKIVRVIQKLDTSAPHETMLIVDACNGQNTVQQTKNFHNALNLTGIIITKLDGTAKGGIVFSLSNQFSIPIRYIGIGEKTNDLVAFNSHDFIEAIFDYEDSCFKSC